MGIKDISSLGGRVELKKDFNKSDKAQKKKADVSKQKPPEVVADSVEIADAKVAIEKENILASQVSIEDFEQAKSLLAKVIDGLDVENLLEIHGNAAKVNSFLTM